MISDILERIQKYIDNSGDRPRERSLYGPPQHDSRRYDDEERSVYGSPQHGVMDAKTVSLTLSETQIRAQSSRPSNVPKQG